VRCAEPVRHVNADGTRKHAWRKTLRRAAWIALEPTPAHIVQWVISGSTLVVLLTMTAVLLDGRVYGWEVDLTRESQRFDYPQWAFDLTANELTNSDTPLGAAIILSVVGLLWFLRLRVESLMVLLISVPLHIVVNFPKAIVERERPDGALDGTGAMKSFPSGHAEFAITFYGFLVYLALLYIRNRFIRVALVAVWVVMVIAVGFARMEANRHWPLDIIGGYVIGVGALSALIWLHASLTMAIRSPGAEPHHG